MDSRPAKIAIVGNCQIAGIAACVQAMNTALEIWKIGFPELEKSDHKALDRINKSDVVFVQTEVLNRFPGPFAQISPIRFPRMYFAGYHPDIAHVRGPTRFIAGPMGRYHSRLVFGGFLNGLSATEIVSLFECDVYQRLDYFSTWEGCVSRQEEEFAESDLELSGALTRWSKAGCFMHTVNHPTLRVLGDIAQAMLTRAGIEFQMAEPRAGDFLKGGPVWPVYPEVAERLGTSGSYRFKRGREFEQQVLSLAEFVEQSLKSYARHRAGSLTIPNLNFEKFSKAAFGRTMSRPLQSMDSQRFDPYDIVCDEEEIDRRS